MIEKETNLQVDDYFTIKTPQVFVDDYDLLLK